MLTHSTLGTAYFEYNADDRLTTLTQGNAAKTAYSHDGHGRLTAFDIMEASHDRLLKHQWDYDALNRKGDITITSPEIAATAIELAYDDASRLTGEVLKNGGSTVWAAGYTYDDAGNRVFYNDNGTTYSMTYDTGNRGKMGTVTY